MNAPVPFPSGDFRSDPDYAAGQALHDTGGQLPIQASTALMRGFLDAMEPKERPDALWANGPGMREPFTQRAADMAPKKPKTDDECLRALPPVIPSMDDDGTPLTLREMYLRYLRIVVECCGGNVSRAARILGEHRQTLQRIMASKEYGRK